ncbi:MAG: hypothetical protein LC659_02730, partial [Myxococcales bacterium]|nr:hypothetical protein [Myxococcales bacterium]
ACTSSTAGGDTMRRMIQGTLLTATLVLPAFAFARPTQGLNTNEGNPQTSGTWGTGTSRFDRPVRPHWRPTNGPATGIGTLGSGALNGNEPGHVDSPGVTKIDPESRGPINDVQPGRGTEDTPQSANPPPAR